MVGVVLLVVVFVAFLFGMVISYKMLLVQDNKRKEMLAQSFVNTVVVKEIKKDANGVEGYYITIAKETGEEEIKVTEEVFHKYRILDRYLE